jgi:nucleoside-diphosphate-sugar epimerase
VTRTKVLVEGSHPALSLVRKWLIRHGASLTQGAEVADFRVVGGFSQAAISAHTVPTIVLSSSDVYWSESNHGSFSEECPLVVASTRDASAFPAIECIASEAAAFRFAKRTLVLRTFNVYGENIEGGFVNAFVARAKANQSITVPLPGYQERTYLFEEDFLEFFGRFWEKFEQGLTGVYNVGATVPISLHRAADIVWQRTRNTKDQAPVNLESLPFRLQWQVTPDMTRTHAEVAYKATTSLSSGVWKMTQ